MYSSTITQILIILGIASSLFNLWLSYENHKKHQEIKRLQKNEKSYRIIVLDWFYLQMLYHEKEERYEDAARYRDIIEKINKEWRVI